MSDYKLVPVEPTEEMIEDGWRLGDVGLHDIYQAMIADFPVVEQEPVAWMYQHEGEHKVLFHDPAEVDTYHGFEPCIPLYTAPPAAPDVTALVELLAECRESIDGVVETPSGPELEPEHSVHARGLVEKIDAALATYRKGEEV